MYDYDPRSWKCYGCGGFGHIKAHCPNHTPPAQTPAAPAPSGAATLPPPVPPRRLPEEIADYAAKSAEIRTVMGWSRDSKFQRDRGRALEQVAASRRERGADLDAMFRSC